MLLTRVLFAKKAKAKDVLVMLESIVSGHRVNLIRPRLDDKLEIIRFDPWIRTMCIYKEKKKVRSM
ncbi:hypothetical protein DAPPUDRAFT_301876 [Daphnia pulex]|uniref:Large ribosomal subunit protein bL33m n=1 Tax=Daphnia pulex TaxID=6669 RepID=E9GB18_DAPPU|nr:hypothetical protein DAPPUDRAFT_301876 [Daphnia pulex]|eukprot:EFX83358.1 hypothetical protein DAPPUDRAFT_301876 [Daphnia pulex]